MSDLKRYIQERKKRDRTFAEQTKKEFNQKMGPFWSFAIVNNKFAEIYFDQKKNGQMKIWGHCYPKRDEFKTKKEQKQIAQDTKKFKFVYKNKKYWEKTDKGLEHP